MGTPEGSARKLMHKTWCGRHRWTGFTLTEIMVAVAVVGILASFAAPSFTDLIARQRIKSASTDLYLALAKARSEAIKRNASVTLAPKSGSWAAGWEIANPADASVKLEDHGAITNATIVGPTSVIYLATGRIRGSTRPTFDISVTGSTAHACVSVDLSGLPTQKSTSC